MTTTSYEVPADLADFYDRTENQTDNLTRAFWRENPDGNPADLTAFVHRRRLDLAREAKANAPYNQAFQNRVEQMRRAHQCLACDGYSGLTATGLCEDCTRVADHLTAEADRQRVDRVRRHLARLAASGQQWRSRPLDTFTASTTDPAGGETIDQDHNGE